MEIPEFLAFEKKKLILPVILVFLLFLVLVLDAVYADQTAKTVHEITQSMLETAKLVIYNTGLNGTDTSVSGQLALNLKEEEKNSANERLIKNSLPMIISYISESVLNTFGTNFCSEFSQLYFFVPSKSECIATKLDLILTSEIIRLNRCLSDFTDTIAFLNRNLTYDTKTGRYYITSEEDIEKWREFVYSERGTDIFNELESCSYSLDTLLDYEKLQEISNKSNSSFLSESRSPPKIILLSPVYIFLYFMILAVVGYLVSCLIIWVHRKNRILH
ncbi:MAG: hypothetical protein QMD97_05315, partial [Candidatus Aenigmarchaeota archaeon]|nr:hypothetical protein [Candidatus Aenigmarchaeota archaeon]